MYRKSLRSILVGLCILLTIALYSNGYGQDARVGVCHATESGSFVLLMLPDKVNGSVSVHIADPAQPDSGHDDDYLASPAEIAAGQCGDAGPGPTPSPGAVPEPVTILLFGAGLAGVGYASRKFRKKS